MSDKKRYLENNFSEPYEILKFIRESEELRKDICPSVGVSIGSLLSILVMISGAKNAIEIGSSIGYSTIYLARGINLNNGKLVTCEISKRLLLEAKRNIELVKLDSCVKFENRSGQEVLKEYEKESLDLIFVDSATKDYSEIYLLGCQKLVCGGIMIFEDVLFSCTAKRKIQAVTMDEFTKKALGNKDFITSILDVDDGLLIMFKKRR